MTENDNMSKERKGKRAKGYLDVRRVKIFAFAVITLCIFLGVLVSIFAIWDFAEKDVLYRTLATLGVVVLGCIIFSIVNEKFGH